MKTLLFAMLVAAGTLVTACDGVTNAIDCNSTCNRYQTCYDKNYDSAACAKRCRDNANSDSNYMQKSETCDACLDNNKDCTSTTFSCGVLKVWCVTTRTPSVSGRG